MFIRIYAYMVASLDLAAMFVFFLYLLNTHFISLKASGKSALLCFLLRKKKFIIFFIAQLRMCVFAFVYSVH